MKGMAKDSLGLADKCRGIVFDMNIYVFISFLFLSQGGFVVGTYLSDVIIPSPRANMLQV